MADKESMERKVYLLPTELVTRLRRYQNESGIASEVEAVRRLLDSALQMRDTIGTIMEKLKGRFQEEKDLRLLAAEILTRHPLVTSVAFGDSDLTFTLQDKFRGQINWRGSLLISYPENNSDDWTTYESYLKSINSSPVKPSNLSTGWDSRPSAELDDEIPF